MRSFTIKTSEFNEMSIERRGKVLNEIYITDGSDGECIRFPVDKIDEVVSALLKLKEEVK